MGNCSGKCDGCGDKVNINIQSSGVKRNDTDSHNLLHPPKKESPRLESLDGCCEHYYFSKIPRHQCMNCIREWVNTVSIEEAERMAEKLADGGKKIASDRIKEAIKEKQWNEWSIE